MNFKKGFTLIELLVVIAIIAILAAILFPVFAQAREKARASSCLSNTKQIGTALQLYTDDYDETVPPLCRAETTNGYLPDTTISYRSHGMASTSWYTWFYAIYPYVKNPDIYNCPSNGMKRQSSSPSTRVLGYGYNPLISLAQSQINTPAMPYGYGVSADHANGFAPVSLSQMKNPSKLVFCGDTYVFKNGGNAFGYVYFGPNLIRDEFNGITGTRSKDGDSPCARHNEGLNYTFCDGHAKFYKKTAGPCEDANWPNGIGYAGQGSDWWNPYR